MSWPITPGIGHSTKNSRNLTSHDYRRLRRQAGAETEADLRYQKHKDDKQARNYRAALEIKMAKGCVDCGYRGHPHALTFDHLPGSQKVNTVARLCRSDGSLATLLTEIEKCEVVCANCHAIRTANRLGETWASVIAASVLAKL